MHRWRTGGEQVESRWGTGSLRGVPGWELNRCRAGVVPGFEGCSVPVVVARTDRWFARPEL
ncbi:MULTISPECIES: hypothetical protein [Odoribacteraceae]|uniref:hypothetical protein n=1 Tax=Odoribacteraceae TaxID=1853231 RepID=UPI0011DD8DCD|nr:MULTISPECIES: hypothetical protein [Odoribacteraceae]MCQ4875552.1 hypothetical protein [Butyricimonas paravirosa]